MKDAGKTRTDWKAAARLPVPEASDPDDAMEQVAGATTTELPMPKRKEHVSLWIDVLAFFRNEGRGYQTRINAVLRSCFEQVWAPGQGSEESCLASRGARRVELVA